MVEEYYTKLMDKYPDGKMDIPDFIGEYFNCSYSKMFFAVMEGRLKWLAVYTDFEQRRSTANFYQHELLRWHKAFVLYKM